LRPSEEVGTVRSDHLIHGRSIIRSRSGFSRAASSPHHRLEVPPWPSSS
jgi:hypothetical protein